MLLTQKYLPKKIDDIIGNEECRAIIKQWIGNWLRKSPQKPLLVYGPPGIGKTALAFAMKEEFDLELVERNASDLRDAANIERVLSSALLASSLFGKGKLLLIDDVDAIQGRDRGGASAIQKIVKEANYPILLTATDPWDKRLSGIRNESRLLEMKKVSASSIFKLLKKISEKERIEVDEDRLQAIAEAASGDVRAAINDLQALTPGNRDREITIFERLKIIFKATTYKEAREASWGDIEYDILKLWIDENIPNEYEAQEDIARAYNALSRSDILAGRIRNSYWGYLRYASDLLTAGVALAKREKYRKFTKYHFPTYLREMSRSIERRTMLKAIGKKLGGRLHTSWRESLLYLPLLRLMRDKRQELTQLFNLSEEEDDFLFGTKPAEPEKPRKKEALERTRHREKNAGGDRHMGNTLLSSF